MIFFTETENKCSYLSIYVMLLLLVMNFEHCIFLYSSKKIKDHYFVAVFWKSSPTDLVYFE